LERQSIKGKIKNNKKTEEINKEERTKGKKGKNN
jgi:hypothetical protein